VDVRINEVHSEVQTVNSNQLLDPQVMRQIVKACVRALKEDQARQKQLAEDRRMNAGASAEDH
jgi:hypothetical protein